jgi:tetratricopeptide (TPR) repeat protein
LFRNISHIFTLTALAFTLNSCIGKRNSYKTNESESTTSVSQLNELTFASKFIDGCAARMKGNFKESLKLFNDCYVINPKSIPLKYELAMIHKLMGVNDKALENAKYCAEAEPKNQWYQLLLIDCYRSLKQYNNAIKVQEQLVKNYPDSPDFKENLAIDYTYAGEYRKAYDTYNELEKQFGVNEQLSLNKIKLLQQENKNAEIEKELQKLILADPSNSRYLTYLAEHYEYIRQPEKAKSIYDKIIDMDPSNPTVHLALSDYYKLKGNEAKAYSELKLAFYNPELDVFTKYKIALVYFQTYQSYPDSDYGTQGMELAKIMLKVHPRSSEANSLYGDYLYFQGNFKEANTYLLIAAEKDKRNYKTWEKLLTSLNRIQNYNALEKHAFEAMELFPSQPYPYYFNGLANMQLKNYKKATEAFRDGLEYVIEDKILMSSFYSYLGDAYYYQKEFEKSDKAFEDALKLNSDNTYVLNQYAYYLSLRNENLDKAEKLSRKSLELKPNEANYMDTYGRILYQLQRFQQAEEWLLKALDFNPKNPTIAEHYGDCLFKLNRIAEAVKAWQKAISNGGDEERLSKKIKEKTLND